MVGVNFFLTSSPILDLEHFSQVILPIVLQIMPLPKNNNNHQVLFTASDGWVDFFLTSSPILDLAHFSQVILPIVLQAICPTIRCRVQHLMVGLIFFLTSSPILDLGHFLQEILPPDCQLYCSQHAHFSQDFYQLVGCRYFFFLTSSPILDLGHFLQEILPIVLQAICPTIRCCSQHLMVGVIFFFLTSSPILVLGLRAFFTSDFANCTTNYALAQK